MTQLLIIALQQVPVVQVQSAVERSFLSVDIGQLIIAALIGFVGYLMKSEIADFKRRLNDHDSKLIQLVSQVQRLIGRTEMMTHTTSWNGTDRRSSETE